MSWFKIFNMKNIPILIPLFLLISLISCSSNQATTAVEAKEISYMKKDILTKNEAEDLLVLREEEKLARDVYMHSYDKYKKQIFYNISLSEQQHMDKVLFLLLKYGLKDPAAIERGKFNNEKLQELYNTLTAQSDISLVEALKVGATIEDLDIFDIDAFMKRTNDVTIIDVYNKLNCGSRNHLRAYVKQIKKYNATYAPQYLSQEKFNTIIKSSQEQCGKNKEKGKGNRMGKGHGQGKGKKKGQGRGRNRNTAW